MDKDYKNLIQSGVIDRQLNRGGLLKVANLRGESRQKGEIILLIEIESSDKDNQEIIETMSQRMGQEYFEAPTKSIEYSFENALSKVNIKMKDILLSKPKNWLTKMHIMAIAVKD